MIPTNKPGAEPKRPGRPVNITRLCDLSASVVNNIVVSWNVEEDRVCAAAFMQNFVSLKNNVSLMVSVFLLLVEFC